MGWLVMVNPPGVLLAGTIWLVLRIQARTRIAPILVAAGTTVLTFLAFLAAGRVVFPRMDWFGTYIDSNARIDYSDFASRGRGLAARHLPHRPGGRAGGGVRRLADPSQ